MNVSDPHHPGRAEHASAPPDRRDTNAPMEDLAAIIPITLDRTEKVLRRRHGLHIPPSLLCLTSEPCAHQPDQRVLAVDRLPLPNGAWLSPDGLTAALATVVEVVTQSRYGPLREVLASPFPDRLPQAWAWARCEHTRGGDIHRIDAVDRTGRAYSHRRGHGQSVPTLVTGTRPPDEPVYRLLAELVAATG